METIKERRLRCVNFIKQNIQLSNNEISKILNIKVRSVVSYMERHGIKRTCEQVHILRVENSKNIAKLLHQKYDFKKQNNPNWKGGISTDNYRYKKISMMRYPEREKARKKVYHAIKRGKLKRMPCEICNETPGFAHHSDYSKPLKIIWLCRKHHREKHNNKH